jgi:hypothetical protein
MDLLIVASVEFLRLERHRPIDNLTF